MLNPFAFLPLVIFVVTTLMWCYVWVNRRSDPTNILFLVLTVNIALSQLCVFVAFLLAPFVADNSAIFRYAILIFYALQFQQGALVLHFMLVISGWRLPRALYGLYGGAVVAGIAGLLSDSIVSGFGRTPWGLVPITGPLQVPLTIGLHLLPVLAGCTALIIRRYGCRNGMDHRQFNSVIMAIGGGTVIAIAGTWYSVQTGRYDVGGPWALSASLWFIIFIYRGVRRHNLLITDRRGIGQAFDLLLAKMGDGIVVTGPRGDVIRQSEGVNRMLNISDTTVLPGLLGQMLPGYTADYEYRNREFILHDESGDRVVMFSQFPLPARQGRPAGAIMLFNDVSELHESRASLEEKEVLLREIHHRVKNNLQVVSSLLMLQSRHVKAPEDRVLFDDSRQRIRAIALVHEKLYQSESIARINCRDYLGRLVEEIGALYRGSGITIHNRIDDVLLSVDKAVPCGLIVSELVSNVYKYAFAGREPGTVSIGVTMGREGEYLLTVADDGVGLPDAVRERTGDTLGLQLVTGLCDQLDGDLTIENGSGTTFTVMFPE